MINKRKLLYLVPVVVGTAVLALTDYVVRGAKCAKGKLSDYFGPLTNYDSVMIFRNGKSAIFSSRDPGYVTALRLLEDLPLTGVRQRFGNDDDVRAQPQLVVTLERHGAHAAVVFAGNDELRLTPPGGRWLLLEGDFGSASRALCALADSWC